MKPDNARRIPRFAAASLLAAMLLCALSGCAPAVQAAPPPESADAVIGIILGTSGQTYVSKFYPNAQTAIYDSVPDAMQALQSGKVHYVMSAYSNVLNYARHNPDIVVYGNALTEDWTHLAVNKGNTALLTQLDAVLTRFKEDGTLDEITSHWIREGSFDYEKVEVPEVADGPVLTIGTCASREPIVFIMEGEIAGLDAELMRRVAYELGMKPVFVDMKYSALIAALQSGKVDLLAANVMATEERRQEVDFTQGYFPNPQYLATRDMAAEAPGFFASVNDSFIKTFVAEGRWKLLLRGLGVTLLITAASAVTGTILGFPLSILLKSRIKTLRLPMAWLCDLLSGIPIVVLLMVLNYVIFAASSMSPVAVAIIGFGVYFAISTAGMLNTGFSAIDKGQTEAALSLGYGRAQTFFRVLLPQAAAQMMPLYTGSIVSMMKLTSVVGYIAVEDLTKASDVIRSLTYDAFFPLITTAILYFLLAKGLSALLKIAASRLDIASRARRIKGVRME